MLPFPSPRPAPPQGNCQEPGSLQALEVSCPWSRSRCRRTWEVGRCGARLWSLDVRTVVLDLWWPRWRPAVLPGFGTAWGWAD